MRQYEYFDSKYSRSDNYRFNNNIIDCIAKRIYSMLFDGMLDQRAKHMNRSDKCYCQHGAFESSQGIQPFKLIT